MARSTRSNRTLWKGLRWFGLLTLSAASAAVLLVWIGARARLDRKYETHAVDIPVPYPAEGLDAKAALAGAIARGRHLVEVRYGCIACHGSDLGGATMVDDPALGSWFAPNITRGAGSRTRHYRMSDWDRIVRHGVKPDGRAAIMPSEDYVRMSDQELSDIVAYIRSLPPVDRRVPPPRFGPIGTVLLALGRLPLTAETYAGTRTHAARPPAAEPTSAFGRHLAQPCMGCHRTALCGGPIALGPPDWPPAANLTPHAQGLGAWSFADFERAMRDGVRPDGSRLRAPMAEVVRQTARMTDVELRALWSYLRALPPQRTGS